MTKYIMLLQKLAVQVLMSLLKSMNTYAGYCSS